MTSETDRFERLKLKSENDPRTGEEIMASIGRLLKRRDLSGEVNEALERQLEDEYALLAFPKHRFKDSGA